MNRADAQEGAVGHPVGNVADRAAQAGDGVAAKRFLLGNAAPDSVVDRIADGAKAGLVRLRPAVCAFRLLAFRFSHQKPLRSCGSYPTPAGFVPDVSAPALCFVSRYASELPGSLGARSRQEARCLT